MTEALRELDIGRPPVYCGSVLEAFYGAWQPADLHQALMGVEGTERLARWPSRLLNLLPWTALSPTEALNQVDGWLRNDNVEHHGSPLPPAEYGHRFCGPIDPVLGGLEIQRLVALRASILKNGYLRNLGDTLGTIVYRRGDWRVQNRGGEHRAAVLAHLGWEWLPVRLVIPPLVDVEDVEHWPQVRSGVWSREGALSLVDHLFGFDARSWARAKGLTVSG